MKLLKILYICKFLKKLIVYNALLTPVILTVSSKMQPLKLVLNNLGSPVTLSGTPPKQVLSYY